MTITVRLFARGPLFARGHSQSQISVIGNVKPVKEIMSGSEMVGYWKSSHVGFPKEQQQRGRVLRVGANSLVGNDVLLPKRFR